MRYSITSDVDDAAFHLFVELRFGRLDGPHFIDQDHSIVDKRLTYTDAGSTWLGRNASQCVPPDSFMLYASRAVAPFPLLFPHLSLELH